MFPDVLRPIGAAVSRQQTGSSAFCALRVRHSVAKIKKDIGTDWRKLLRLHRPINIAAPDIFSSYANVIYMPQVLFTSFIMILSGNRRVRWCSAPFVHAISL